MATKLITPPALEPLTLTETKDHLRYTASDQDAYISELIPAARRWAEKYTRRALLTQSWDFFLDCFPGETGIIEVPMPALQSVTSINYVDAAGVSQLLDTADYQVDTNSQPGRLRPAIDATWPQTRRGELNAVTVRFVAGYGTSPAQVPAGIRQGMLMLIGHMFERREDSITGTMISKVPKASEWLCDPYRIMKPVY